MPLRNNREMISLIRRIAYRLVIQLIRHGARATIALMTNIDTACRTVAFLAFGFAYHTAITSK